MSTDHETQGGTPQIDHKHPTPSKPYVIATALLIVAVIIVNIVQNQSSDQETDTATDSQSDVVVTITDGTEASELTINIDELVYGYGLDIFDDLDQAGSIINSTQGKPTAGTGSESLVANVVESDQEHMVYFATKSHDRDTQETFVGIYHYNTESNRWQRLYKNTFESEEDQPTPYLRVLARSGNHLVLMQDQQDNSPGPCANPWLTGDEEDFGLMLMNLEDPYAGFIDFPLPDSIRSEAEQEQLSCQANY